MAAFRTRILDDLKSIEYYYININLLTILQLRDHRTILIVTSRCQLCAYDLENSKLSECRGGGLSSYYPVYQPHWPDVIKASLLVFILIRKHPFFFTVTIQSRRCHCVIFTILCHCHYIFFLFISIPHSFVAPVSATFV